MTEETEINRMMLLGKGSFANVWLMTYDGGAKYYALKEVQKCKLKNEVQKKSFEREMEILLLLKSNFIIRMKERIETRLSIGLVLELQTGGDLRYHLMK